MKCPNCGVSPLVHATRDMVYTYKGKSTMIPDVIADYCSGCREVVCTRGEEEHYGELIRAFRKQVDLEAGQDIRNLRKKLGLTQQKADELFADGPGEFSRLESGQADAPAALLKLLRLVGRHPHLLDEVR
ncbi:type II toxin-antitoxin system MqsA family antitoxin [Massilia sp. ST3]|nr:type II toxin-antitoxin system MqsA family antitoxin [Massilia sp. ST3]